jgi:aspartokinase
MKIGGLVENSNLTMYQITSIKDEPGAAAKILKLFAQEKISLQYITESNIPGDTAVMSICVDAEQAERIDQLIAQNDQIKRQIKITKIAHVSVLGIYGPHFRDKPVLAAMFCKILGEAGINILGLSSSISSISSVIVSEQLHAAKNALLEEFELP